MSPRTIVVTNNRSASNGVSNKNCQENKVGVHNDSVGCHTVLSGNPHKLKIVEDIDQGGGQVGDHFRGAVDAGIGQNPFMKGGLGKAKQTVIWPEK